MCCDHCESIRGSRKRACSENGPKLFYILDAFDVYNTPEEIKNLKPRLLCKILWDFLARYFFFCTFS
jgi:hypothetical protein